jgi:3-phenylpropionate/trans-cinnamate dioxygenase ferredoxin subunit
VRIEDEFFCVDDCCSHEDYSLSEGEVLEEECEIECWKHGSTFDLKTGEPRSLPATKPVAVYSVNVSGEDVMVELP